MKLDTARLLLGVEASISRIEETLAKLIKQGATTMAKIADLAAKLDELEATVAAQSTVMDSAISLMNGLSAINASLRQELADAIANNASPAEVQAILDRMAAAETAAEEKTQALAAAISANTPAQG